MFIRRIVPITFATLAAVVLMFLAVQPRLLPVRADSQGLVGAWVIDLTSPNEPPGKLVATFTSDGTYMEAGPDSGHGAWMQKPGVLPGERIYLLTTASVWSDDDTGAYQGSSKVKATITVSDNGETFTAPFTGQVFDKNGRVIETFTGTAKGTRINVEQ